MNGRLETDGVVCGARPATNLNAKLVGQLFGSSRSLSIR